MGVQNVVNGRCSAVFNNRFRNMYRLRYCQYYLPGASHRLELDPCGWYCHAYPLSLHRPCDQERATKGANGFREAGQRSRKEVPTSPHQAEAQELKPNRVGEHREQRRGYSKQQYAKRKAADLPMVANNLSEADTFHRKVSASAI